MEDIIKDLNKLKEEIDASKSKLSLLRGREEELMKRLKNEFGLTSLTAAEKKIKKDTDLLELMKDDIEEKYNELKTQFEW